MWYTEGVIFFMKKTKKVAPIQTTQTEKKAVGLKTKLEQNKNWADRLADRLTVVFGSTGFLLSLRWSP